MAPASRRDASPQGEARVRRDLPQPRGRVGRAHGQRRRQRLLGGRAAPAHGGPRCRAAGGQAVRRGRDRRGAGLRRSLVADCARGAPGRGDRRAVRLLRRGPARLLTVRRATRGPRATVLDHNLRNTRQIANSFSSPHPDPDAPRRCRRPRRAPSWSAAAKEALECRGRRGRRTPRGRLATAGRRAADHRQPPPRADATPGRRPRERTGTASGTTSRCSTDTFSASRASSAAPSSSSSTRSRRSERSRERLYVGLSRPRDQLVVCGDPDYIAEVGGEAVLRRLRLS